MRSTFGGFIMYLLSMIGCGDDQTDFERHSYTESAPIEEYTDVEQTTQHPYNGTYKLGSNRNEKNGRFAFQAQEDGSIKFELEIHKSGPEKTSGFSWGKLELEGNTGVWKTKEYEGPCILSFSFEDNQVTIKQDGSAGDCGFGLEADVNGIYSKTSDEVELNFDK